MRIVANTELRLRDAHGIEQLDRFLPRRAPRRPAVNEQGLFDLASNREDRIQRRHWFLKDQRNLCSTNFLHLPFSQVAQLARLEEHLAALDVSRRLDEPHDRERSK